MHPRTRLVYFYFLRVELMLKTWSQGRRHIVRLPWQRYICRSKYGCFYLSPKVTYLHTKIEEGLKFFISNFASLSWRIALKIRTCLRSCDCLYFIKVIKKLVPRALLSYISTREFLRTREKCREARAVGKCLSALLECS